MTKVYTGPRCQICYGEHDGRGAIRLCVRCYEFGRLHAIRNGFRGDPREITLSVVENHARENMATSFQVANIIAFGPMPEERKDHD